jgi:Asp-tRNA(Asn)/Glu-tRNA(Gln) amidotransferase A subunit family amidase
MQLVGRPFREHLLLRVGAAYEAAADRRGERPPL